MSGKNQKYDSDGIIITKVTSEINRLVQRSIDSLNYKPDFILDMLLHFRDSGTEPSLGLQRTSGVDPSSPQSETFLKLLTQPEALRDIYNVDMDMRGAKSPTEFFEGIPKQNAVMMAVESLLGGDTNILDVIKELDPNSNSGNSQINQEIMKQDFLDKLNEYGK